MGLDPYDSGQPFNRLFDTCKFRGHRLELHVGGVLHRHGAAAGSRDLNGVSVQLAPAVRAYEAIRGGNLAGASQRLLARL